MRDCVISVVIPTYNRRDVLLRCLEHLEAQTVGPEVLQVLVVDDGSPDDTVPTARSRPHRFADYHVLEQENAGPGAARNRALERATAPLTIFINDDTLLAPTAIEEHLRVHGDHPMSMVLGTFEFVEEFRHEPLGRLLTEVPLLFAYPLIEDGDELSAALGATCNLSVDTNAARVVGFDPWFDFPAVEDVDFSIRLEEAGYQLRFCATAEARHDHHLTVPGIMRTSLIRGLGSARLELKRGPSDKFVNGVRATAAKSEELRRLFDATADELTASLDMARGGGPIPEPAYEAVGRIFRLGNLLGALDEPKIIAYAEAA
jgi:GT2 family glycosyltransferase